MILGLSVPFRCILPVGAGFAVAALQSQGFSPALKFLTRAIEGVVDDNTKAGLPTSYAQVGPKRAQQRVQRVSHHAVHARQTPAPGSWAHIISFNWLEVPPKLTCPCVVSSKLDAVEAGAERPPNVSGVRAQPCSACLRKREGLTLRDNLFGCQRDHVA